MSASKTRNLIKDFLKPKNIFAVVGVSTNPHKYGYKVYMDLLKAGYQVYPVHPAGGFVNGHKRYVDLASLPCQPDVVSVVVPPKISLQIIKECKQLGINKVWLQPGSESQAVMNYCHQHQIKVLSGLCIMLEKNKL